VPSAECSGSGADRQRGEFDPVGRNVAKADPQAAAPAPQPRARDVDRQDGDGLDRDAVPAAGMRDGPDGGAGRAHPDGKQGALAHAGEQAAAAAATQGRKRKR
jgi:hypothetical protein